MAVRRHKTATHPLFARVIPVALIALIAFVLITGSLGCALTARQKPRLVYSPEELRAALLERVPELSERLTQAPFSVGPEDVALAKKRTDEAPLGPPRVRALVDALTEAPPRGFGLEYHWLASMGAKETLAARKGNCVALASVLVGLGRGLGWPIYYAVAMPRRPETYEYEAVTFIADHMVVIVAAKTFQMVIDFTGQVEEGYAIRPIDDLTAYAHLINNVAGQRLALQGAEFSEESWRQSLAGFELATRIQPELGRGWNNRGIALTRLGRYAEARVSYERALELDTAFDSAEHNLAIMQTRSSGQVTVTEKPIDE